MGLWPEFGPVAPVIISTVSRWSMGRLNKATAGAAPSVNSPGLAAALFYPFMLPERWLASKMFLLNGSTVAGNIDLGIYDSDFRRIVSSGSVAQAGVSVLQEVDITDTLLERGLYYMAVAWDTTTMTYYSSTASNSVIAKLAGRIRRLSVFPLPADGATGTINDTGSLIMMGVSTRTLVA